MTKTQLRAVAQDAAKQAPIQKIPAKASRKDQGRAKRIEDLAAGIAATNGDFPELPAFLRRDVSPEKLAELRESAMHANTDEGRAAAIKTPASWKGKPAKPAKASAPKGNGKGRRYDYAGAAEAAERGVMPPKLDFSADTHKSYRPKLAALEELAAAGDLKGLRAYELSPAPNTSPTALRRWRDMAVAALKAKGGEAKPEPKASARKAPAKAKAPEAKAPEAKRKPGRPRKAA